MNLKYLESLSPKEKQAYEVAKKHLGSLLTIEKTNGYKKWMMNLKQEPTTTSK